MDMLTFKLKAGRLGVENREIERWVLQHSQLFSLRLLSTTTNRHHNPKSADLTIKYNYKSRSPHFPKHTIAYHGTAFENIWSILHFGLLNHLQTRALFGPGIYLSLDIGTAMSFSKSLKQVNNVCKNYAYFVVLKCEVRDCVDVRRGKDSSGRGNFDFSSFLTDMLNYY